MCLRQHFDVWVKSFPAKNSILTTRTNKFQQEVKMGEIFQFKKKFFLVQGHRQNAYQLLLSQPFVALLDSTSFFSFIESQIMTLMLIPYFTPFRI